MARWYRACFALEPEFKPQFLYSFPSMQIYLATNTQPTPRVKQARKAAESPGVQ